MILVIDNYDSFVHNLARLVRLTGRETRVVRNDEVGPEGVERLRPKAIVLSPGPGAPASAGCSVRLVQRLHRRVPMLGVCLGHQAIVEALGGAVVRAPEPLHGRTSAIEHNGEGLFAGAPRPMTVCRYHSLAAEATTLPSELEPTAWSDDGVVMAVAHRELPVYGVQFHPEAILTEGGAALIANFCGMVGR